MLNVYEYEMMAETALDENHEMLPNRLKHTQRSRLQHLSIQIKYL